ncbi:MAG: hypothetical protein O7B77_07815 [Actinobacteria bacterium]|nr:hypothetical protein [Actinomycetota bacterium]
MADKCCEPSGVFAGLWETIQEQLQKQGIDLEQICAGGAEDAPFKVVCVTPGLKQTVEEMARSPRDQVVMVRVDEETARSLDAWVETDAVKSRSEAAALFIREGIKVRSGELDQLREALEDVGQAKQRLEEQARQVIGNIPDTTN